MVILELKIIMSVFFAILFYKFNILDQNGSFFAGLMGLILWHIQDLTWVLIMIGFVFVSTIATKYRYAAKKKLWVAEERSGTRRSKNVMANGIIPLMVAILGRLYNIDTFAYFIGAVSAATGDTLSSELGVLSKKDPYLITSFKRVDKGTDGAISILGEAASIFGGILIGMLAIMMGFYQDNPLLLLTITVFAAIGGSTVDSVIGATLERKGFVTNEIVNFICTVSGAYIASFFL